MKDITNPVSNHDIQKLKLEASAQSRLTGTAGNFEDFENLMQQAVASGGLSTITISQSFDFPRTILLNSTTPNVNILFQCEEGTTLGVEGFYRHFDITSSGAFILELKGAVLDGGSQGGGINYTGSPFFYLFSGSITNCTAYNGGGLYVDGNAVIEAMHFSHNTTIPTPSDSSSNTGGAVYIQNGELLIFAETLIEYNGNSSVRSGGGVYAAENCSVSIRLGILQYNEAETGGGITLANNATLDMSGYIQSNKAYFGGGGIYGAYITQAVTGEITETSYINVNGHVKDNETQITTGGIYGGVVTINRGGFVSRNTVVGPGSEAGISCARFVMEDGIVSDNRLMTPAAGYTPGVGIKCRSALINGGTISGNAYVNDTGKPTGGGAIFCSPVLDGDTVVINGGVITGNKAHNGGGIYMEVSRELEVGSLIISGNVSISENAADANGGGLFLSNVEAELSGPVRLSENTATRGGAIAVNRSALVLISSVILSGNNAGENGGAVWIDDLEKLSVQEPSVAFLNNRAQDGYRMTDPVDIALHERLINTNTFSQPFQYAYNNYDVVYLEGQLVVDNVTITFESNGGSPVPSQSASPGGLVQEPEEPSKPSYIFTGWYADTELQVPWDFSQNTVSEDITLYAGWRAEPAVYTITYDPNGGIGCFLQTVESETYTVLSLSNTGISRSEYAFSGWNTSPDGSGVSYNPGATITLTDDIVLYAQWVAIEPDLYSITYTANGGTGAYSQAGLESGSSYTVLSPEEAGISRSGYAFSGWNTSPEGSGTVYNPGDTLTVTSDIILYAQWAVAPTLYTATYDANGGSGGYIDTDLVEGNLYAVRSLETAGIIWSDHLFTGWNTVPDGSGVSYDPGNEILVTGDIILYAQWSFIIIPAPCCIRPCCLSCCRQCGRPHFCPHYCLRSGDCRYPCLC